MGTVLHVEYSTHNGIILIIFFILSCYRVLVLYIGGKIFMPILSVPITEYTEHIFDPILAQIVNRIIYRLGYQEVFEDRIEIRPNYAQKASTTSDHNNNAQTRDSRFIADVTIQMQPDSTKWPTFNFNHTAAYGISPGSISNQNLLFLDKNAKVSMWEQSSPCSIMLACRMHFLNKVHAYQTPYLISNRYLNGSILEGTDLFYDYAVPKDMVFVIQNILNLRDLPFDIVEYLKRGSDGIIGLVKNNRTGDRAELVVTKAQVHSLYSVEYSDEQPNEEKTGAAPNSFIIPFTYNLQFSIPNILFLEYPIVIKNKLVPQECIPISTVEHPPAFEGPFTFSAMEDYYENYYIPKQHEAVFINPFYDDWIPPPSNYIRRASQVPIIIAASLIDDVNKVMTFDLKEELSEGFRINPILLDIIKAQGNLSLRSDALFNIAIYRDDIPIDKECITLSEDLVLTTPATDINKVYRLVISQLMYIFNLNEQLWDLAFKYRFFLGKLDQINRLFELQVPYWRNSTTLYFESNTKSYIDRKTKKVLFRVDEQGRMYRDVKTKLNGIKREYFDDLTYLPEGVHDNGAYTTLRVLNTDLYARTRTS